MKPDIFEPIALTDPNDQEWVIPPNRVLGAIARIEEVVSLHELSQFASRGAVPLAKLATAYASVLRYAGAKATPEEVYAKLFEGNRGDRVNAAITGLLVMMIPPKRTGVEAPAMGNASPAAAPLSPKRTKRRSGRGGSALASSGSSTPSS